MPTLKQALDPFHPIALLWPPLSDEALQALKASIALHGQIQPIVVYDGLILDGCNRWRAIEALNQERVGTDLPSIEPRLVDCPEGADPVQYCISSNENRRHMSIKERAKIAKGLAQYDRGRRTKADRVNGMTQYQAAQLMGVSVGSLKRAKKQDKPEAVEKAESTSVPTPDDHRTALEREVDRILNDIDLLPPECRQRLVRGFLKRTTGWKADGWEYKK